MVELVRSRSMNHLRRGLIAGVVAGALAACGDGDGGGGGSGGVSTPAPTPSPTPTPTPTPTPSPTPSPSGFTLTGDLAPAADPAIIAEGGVFYIFTTGALADREGLLPMRTSTDLQNFTYRGAVYPQIPAYAAAAVPGTSGIWAPDIVKRGGEYRLYYSVSTFGSNRSLIGLTTNTSLNGAAPSAGWSDKGAVIQSNPSDNFNAIDPAVFTDAEGREWMAFGSFFSGIRMVRLDPATGLRLASDPTVYSLASRAAPNAVEAPYVVRRGGFYYLFASFDFCCQGTASTYNTVVGRSTSPTGPYVDRDGRQMLQGGGTLVLSSGQGTDSRFVGRGHTSFVQSAGADFLVHHAYDRERNGAPTLQVTRLDWDAAGWPTARP
jgi:arabinan endo-1,5-alpha-L-arabinosidase